MTSKRAVLLNQDFASTKQQCEDKGNSKLHGMFMGTTRYMVQNVDYTCDNRVRMPQCPISCANS